MYCKIVDISNNIMTLILSDDTILKVKANEEISDNKELMKKYGEINIINGSFNRRAAYYDIKINILSIAAYKKLENSNNLESQRMCNKAKLLGIENTHRISDDGILIIGDYNRVLQRSIYAETIRFIGHTMLVKDTDAHIGVKINLVCKKAIIENFCVMGNLLISTSLDSISVIAENYILSHSLMDKYTVDEIFHIFRFMLTSQAGEVILRSNFDVMRKILIDTSKIKDNKKELVNRTLRLMHDALFNCEYDNLDIKIGEKLAMLYTAICMHESLDYKFKQLSTAIVDLSNNLIQYENSMQYNNRIRYQRLRQDYQNKGN